MVKMSGFFSDVIVIPDDIDEDGFIKKYQPDNMKAIRINIMAGMNNINNFLVLFFENDSAGSTGFNAFLPCEYLANSSCMF